MHAGEGSTGVEIRPMRPLDVEGVHELMLATLDEYFVPEIPAYFLNQWSRGSFVAVDFMGEIVGYIAGSSLPGNRASVALLCVASHYRRRGIASVLLSRLMHSAFIEGLHPVQLEVRTDNYQAIQFYEARGFVIVETLPVFYNDGGDAYRMVSSNCTN